jgi:hypothetical protein
MQAEQKLVVASLNQQASQAEQQLSSINKQIDSLPAQPSSTAERSQLKKLQEQRTQTTAASTQLRQTAIDSQINDGSATNAAVKGSVVLDAAVPLAHSRLKPLLLDIAVGIVVGLLLGMVIVILQALTSDRLRQRDDVARALGAPVKLSVRSGPPKGRLGRFLPSRRRSAVDADIERVAAHLGRAVPGSSKGPAALAVVPVDDSGIPAQSLVSLALSVAGQGRQVVVADLCGGAPAARLLGATDPGVHVVNARDTRLVVAVPEPGDVAPLGPLNGGRGPDQRSPFAEEAAAASARADLLLTLVSLDPSLYGEHLATWATDAVAVVTAGWSSWTKIHSAGEMVRLSGVRLVSAVLTGADSTDESLGLTYAPETV